ncbi:thioredoxin domain-containing protein [Reichenbachiella agarivorans]|uniref:Thioredoxin domain-containing protein n=1 Tax=Reichenbachiella agarivorans TaxID=2979464 RepID=A0ABY6CKA0_9BACT|nr:thioredoxin domain-containing protein [Reichenbachiella agarivorans]UXP30946.1 thioredoxin domain-containing protein [Reichenbachiella agarivorans]
MMKYLTLVGIVSLLFLHACDMNKGKHPYTNALINESSPYLLQHAHNPVDWQPWGNKALNQAKKENKLIIVSIGYAACHWCHVMEHESFEDLLIAEKMNENYVSIKVDREERPDIDQVYMNAAQLLTGRGGWPLNIVALPDGRPVFAGTYFSKEDWDKILDYFHAMYKSDPQKMLDQAEKVTEGIAENEMPTFNQSALNYSADTAQHIANQLLSELDTVNGGKSGAPKFPMPVIYEYLMAESYYRNNPAIDQAIQVTLNKMSAGGIYDHLGGGFSRYSVDGTWTVPHFEKMLYDNAQLISLYSHAYQRYGTAAYQQTIVETIAFCKRELKDSLGGYYSSLDADSEGEEGKFYVWGVAEIDSLLGEKAQFFKTYYGISVKGNFEGKNILERKGSLAQMAKEYGMTEAKAEGIIAEAKATLFHARSQRIRPALDDKILTSWNGLMIMGLVDAYFALGNEQYLADALETGEFLLGKQVFDGNRIHRNFKDGKSSIHGFLDDYAFSILAFVKLYEATFDEKWLYKAKELKEFASAHFLDDKTQMYYYTSDTDEKLIARKMELSDNVIPGSNSAMAQALFLLGQYFYDENDLKHAQQMIANSQANFSEHPYYYSNMARLYSMMGETLYEVAIVGPEAATKRNELAKGYIPNKILLGGKNEGTLDLLEGKRSEGNTFIYVCQNKSCQLPTQEVAQALKQIR